MMRFPRLGQLWSRYDLRGRDLRTVDVRTALRDGGSALVCLPGDPAQHASALEVCDRLFTWFAPITPVWLRAKEQVAPLPESAAGRVIEFSDAVNWVGLPHRRVVRHVQALAPQVAVDLNPEFSLATAALCVESGATLRIGFGASESGHFNLVYAWWDDGIPLALAKHYERFLALLADLSTSADV